MKQILLQLIDKKSLSIEQAQQLMTAIMEGQLDDISLAALLIALKMKGETKDELFAFASVMKKFSTSVELSSDINSVDIVGTGGDGLNTFNISTTCAFVARGAGVTIAKHGNRSSSGLFGSADLLEAVGINLNLNPAQVAECVEQLGIGFMFAPNHHPAMKHVRQVRKQLKVRTVFNLLGPLTNPSGAQRQVIGVFSKKWLRPMAECFQALGSKHCLLVHSTDGLDELSCFANNYLVELNQGKISEYQLHPSNLGLAQGNLKQITINSLQQAVELFNAVLDGKAGAARNIVLLNSAAAIYVSGLAHSIEQGLQLAIQSIDSGQAKYYFEQLLQKSHQC